MHAIFFDPIFKIKSKVLNILSSFEGNDTCCQSWHLNRMATTAPPNPQLKDYLHKFKHNGG